jgi:predicted RNA methylase
MSYGNILEEELKNKLAKDYFWIYDCTKIIGNVDFCVAMYQSQKEIFEQESLLWAEAKRGISDIYKSLVQLILTIGKARTFDNNLPPAMLGAFDSEKIAFIPYNIIHDIFYQNDFNWNVTPSNHETKEFQLVYVKVKNCIDQNSLLFYYNSDDKELKRFIKDNFIVGKFGFTKIKIDKNNFMVIYNKWLETVKPTIAVNWEIAKKSGIIDGDFYLADLLSSENETIKDKLYVLLKISYYELDRKINEMGMFNSSSVSFTDKQKAHTQFWNKYERPPKEEYWDYIVNRRDLLVPQDVRERKGSFFTPQIWVELSQKYLTDVLGEDWQDEYYVWDCAAGTGNLLAGLTNKYNIWASTLDRQDVDVMKDRIKNGANLLEDHVFQFDFLNDEFTKLPKPLQDIINNPKKRKKLVVYINPPYAEAGSGVGRSFKANVSLENITYKKYKAKLGKGINELFIQFLIRIYFEIPECIIGEFSKLKAIQSPNFEYFRNLFLSKLEKCFVVPANTFDNVKGSFPIGFKVWNCNKKEKFEKIKTDVFLKDGLFLKNKIFYSYDNEKGMINDWLRLFFDKKTSPIAILHNNKNDFQHNIQVRITIKDIKDHTTPITQNNLIQMCIYLSVRHSMEATWLNDRDQFLYPNDSWQIDKEFQSNCLTYSLFHGQNKISSKEGTNHWIPFTEYEVGAREKFDSNFMTKFIQGKLMPDMVQEALFSKDEKYNRTTPLEFSVEAKEVFKAGKELWRYYHQQPNCNVNASLYDIREHFQGRNAKGKMNNKSKDENYMKLIKNIREKLHILENKIKPKVYEYGFLKE